jgi:hypothetical protein
MTTADDMTATERYLAAVRTELADLPDAERTDLLEDVEQHLLEVSAEADEALDTVLGPPEQYAAELRAAAGLPARGADEAEATSRGARITSWVRRDLARLNNSRTYWGIRDFLPELRPGWWVLRGYLAALALGMFTNRSEWELPIPTIFDNPLLGIVALAFAIRLSVGLGRRELGLGLRLATHLGSAVVVVLAMIALANDHGTRTVYETSYVGQESASSELFGPNGPITNIYPYAADGTPLDNVLLYDQNGQPVANSLDVTVCVFQEPAEQPCPGPGRRSPAHLYPHPEPIVDPNTGEVIGEKARPVIRPPATVTPTPTSSSASPTPTPTPSRTGR